MKLALLLTLALPFALAADPICELPIVENFDEYLQEVIEGFLKIISENKNQEASTGTVPHEPKSPIYSIIVPVVNNILATLKPIGPIEKINITQNAETPLLLVENATININDALLVIDSPGTSFNIANMSVIIPELIINADHYKLSGLDLGIVNVSGEGRLKLTLRDFRFGTSMDVKYRSLKFEVLSVHMVEFGLETTKFELENLGGEGEALANLLNSIVSDLLPSIVIVLSECINSNWPDDTSLLNFLFSLLFNSLLCVADPSKCD